MRARRKNGKAVALEHGDIFFFYHPKVTSEFVTGPGDVASFHIVLHPLDGNRFRYAAIDIRGLPVNGRASGWSATIEAVEDNVKLMHRRILESHPLPARPFGEGVYTVARHAGHTHLAYALELPDTLGEVQWALGLERSAAPFLAVVNPMLKASAAMRSPEVVLPDYPPDLLASFGDSRLRAAEPVNLLDYEGAEFLVTAMEGMDPADLGLDLMPERENEETAEVFDLLRIHPREVPAASLFEGRWA